MGDYGQKLISGLILLGVVFLSGCGDFFAQKPVELQTDLILDELREVRESPHIKNPLPELYRGKAIRIKVKDGIKLFYFTKNHTPDKLASLVTGQLGHKINVSGPTNQLIIHCLDDEQAEKTLEFLAAVDIAPIQVNIDCLILERFADVTTDWETTIKIDNFLGEKITFGGQFARDSKGEFIKTGRLDKFGDAINELLPNFPGASLREAKRATFGLDFGYWSNMGIPGHEFRAVVDVLISRGYLKVLMNPTLETMNGQKAKIVSREYVPLEKILSKEGFDEPFSLTEYQWVEDTLEVTPQVFADGSISLETAITIGSRSKPEGVVQASIITERSITIAENRIKPGESMVIGGIRKTVERAVIRGVPFFKDLPIIGILFSSKDFEENSTEVIFILTPSISSGSIEHTEMIEDIRGKFAKPKYERGIGDVITDPFYKDKNKIPERLFDRPLEIMRNSK